MVNLAGFQFWYKYLFFLCFFSFLVVLLQITYYFNLICVQVMVKLLNQLTC